MKHLQLKKLIKEEIQKVLSEVGDPFLTRGSNKYITLVQHANKFLNFLKNVPYMKVKDETFLQDNLKTLKLIQRNLKIAKLNYPFHVKSLSGALNYVTEMIDGIESMSSAEEVYDLLNSGYIIKEFLDNVVKPVKNLPLSLK